MTAPYEFAIETAKIESYLLNVEHPRGASKARFFIGRGYEPSQPKTLARDILSHGRHNFPGAEKPSKYGPIFELRAEMSVPDGTSPIVCSVWQLRAATFCGSSQLIRGNDPTGLRDAIDRARQSAGPH